MENKKFEAFLQGVVNLKKAAHQNEKVNFSGLHKKCNSFVDALRKFQKKYPQGTNIDSNDPAKIDELKKDIHALLPTLNNVVSKVTRKELSNAVGVSSALTIMSENLAPGKQYKTWAGYINEIENNAELIDFAKMIISANIPEPKGISDKLKSLLHKAVK